MNQYPRVINTFGKFVHRPFIFAFSCGKFKGMDQVSIDRGFTIPNRSAVAVDPHHSLVMRDGKDEDLVVELFRALHQLEQFHHPKHRQRYAVLVLSVSNLERRRTTLHLLY